MLIAALLLQLETASTQQALSSRLFARLGGDWSPQLDKVEVNACMVGMSKAPP